MHVNVVHFGLSCVTVCISFIDQIGHFLMPSHYNWVFFLTSFFFLFYFVKNDHFFLIQWQDATILSPLYNGKGESNIKKKRPGGLQPGFLCPGNQTLQLIITANYDGRTTKAVTTDVAASGVRQRFTYYTSNLDVF